MQNEFYRVYKPKIEAQQATLNVKRNVNKRRKTFAPIMGICIATTGLFAAQGTDIKFTPGAHGEGRTVTFSWSNPISFSEKVVGDELILRFPDSIKFINEKAMNQASQTTGDGINYGYDSIVFKHNPDESMTVEKGAKAVTIHITKNPEKNTSFTAEPSDLNLKLVEVRIALDKGEFKKAFEILDVLSMAHPDDVQVLQVRGDAEFSVGRWEMAYQHIQEAKKKAPLNEDIKLIEIAIEDQYGPYARLNGEYRKTGNIKTEQFGRVGGRAKIAPGLFFGIESETNDIKAKNITRAKTGIIGNYNAVKTRGNVYGEFNADNGNQVRGYVYGQKTLGGGAEAHFNDLKGYYILQADYHKPYWDWAQGVLDNGVVDKFIVGRRYLFNPHFFGEVRTGVNRYGIDGTKKAGDSTTLWGILSYTFPAPTVSKLLGRTGEITVAYNLDGEYTSHVKSKIGVQGNSYKPLPIGKRELHGLELSYTADLLPKLNNYGYVGYIKDRFGGHGPRAGYRLTYKPTDHIRAIAEVGTTINNTASSQTENFAIAELKWVF